MGFVETGTCFTNRFFDGVRIWARISKSDLQAISTLAYIASQGRSCTFPKFRVARNATVFVLPVDSPLKRERDQFGDITLRMSPTMSACMLSMTGFVGHLMSTRNRGLWIASIAVGFYVRNAVRSTGDADGNLRWDWQDKSRGMFVLQQKRKRGLVKYPSAILLR